MEQLCPQVCRDRLIQLHLVRESIEREGLRYPLMVFPLHTAMATRLRKSWGLRPGNLNRYFCVHIGNQRWAAAMDLGYTHIDCIICNTAAECCNHPIAKLRHDNSWVPRAVLVKEPSGRKELHADRGAEEYRLIPAEWLAPKVGLENLPQLRLIVNSVRDVRKGRLIYPLMVVPCTYERAFYWRGGWGLESPESHDHPWYMIVIGNQRYAAALELGYTHIACIVKDTGKECLNHPIGLARRDDFWIQEAQEHVG